MENLGADFGTFVFSVLAQWLELLSGCVVLAFIGLLEKYVIKREIPLKVYTLVLAAFVFWACFQAWQEQYAINKNAPGNQMVLSNLQTEIRDLKDSRIGATAELNTLRSEKEALIRELNALRDEMKLAQASLLAPEVDVAQPYLHEDPNEILLIIPVINLGQTRTTILSSETTLLNGGHQYSQVKNNVPVLLRPKNQPYNFPIPLNKDLFIDDGKQKLAVFEYTYKGILNDERVNCVVIEISKEKKIKKRFEMPGAAPKECRKSAKKR